MRKIITISHTMPAVAIVCLSLQPIALAADNDYLIRSPQMVPANDLVELDSFGQSVALGNGIAAAGAGKLFSPDNIRGAVYRFRQDAGRLWVEFRRVIQSDGVVGDGFGESIALDDDLMAVGASGHDIDGIGGGAVYVFVRDAGGTDNWGLVQIQHTPSEASVQFGCAVALDGGWLMAGDPNDQTLFSDRGAATLFPVSADSDGDGSVT